MEISQQLYNFNPNSGQLLISEPFLSDPNFRKSVILLCEHEIIGSVGFIINKLMSMDTDEVIPGLLSHNFPIFYGGPVEKNTLHFIHKKGLLIDDSIEIGCGVFWGGDISKINELLKDGKANSTDFKFFIGYSGWAEGQLQSEIDQKAWWACDIDEEVVFTDDIEEIWPICVKKLGPDFAYLANSPDDYHWN